MISLACPPRRAATLAATAIVAWLVTGCAGKAVPPPSLWTPGLVQEVAACHQARATFVGRARVRLAGPDGNRSAAAWIAVRFPDEIRVELQDPFGRPGYFLVVSGGRLSVLDTWSHAYFQGEAREETVARFFQVGFGPAWAARVLSGCLLRDAASAEGPVNDSGAAVVVEDAESAGARWRLFADDAAGAVARAERERDGRVDLVVEYGGFPEGQRCAAPGRVHVRALASGAEMDIIYQSSEWDRPFGPDAFSLPVPEGVDFIPLP